jgi:16S rRNA (guanine1207-N2)-methyltransferase
MTDDPTPPDARGHNHYFSESPATPSQPTEFVISSPAGDLVVTTDSGVFSRHGLDKGTAVLLDSMKKRDIPTPAPGSFLADIGCGSGALALVLAARFPQCTVIAIDINERARELCAANAARNGLTNVVVAAPDDAAGQQEFECIWSNPPIRVGKSALHDILRTWMQRLSPTGRAYLVVSKNLGADSLSDWLTTEGFPATKLASSKGFRVLEVRRSL